MLGENTGLEQLDLVSKDVPASYIEKIGNIVPEVLTESRDANGELKLSIDFDKLRALLGEVVTESDEKYDFTWVGKREAISISGQRTTMTLRPDLNESDNFEQTGNVFITGDNLEVLKILQESYLNKIDMIYIDPPYNTGNDFVYSDNFRVTSSEITSEMNLVDDDGFQVKGLTKNERTSSRYHSDWLNMMYSRLRLARNLLKDSGTIFISIDDNEQANLKLICDEIFGEDNIVQTIAWRRSDNQPNVGRSARVKEYIYVYAKDYSKLIYGRLPLSEAAMKEYAYEDDFGKYGRGVLRHEVRGRFDYIITSPSGRKLHGPWMVPEEEFKRLDKLGKIHWPDNGGVPRTKIYLDEAMKKGQIANDFWGGEFGTNQRANAEIKELFDCRIFDFSKPTKLIKSLISLGSLQNGIILDFFAGSATTSDAIMQLNAEDGGNRKYILCTLDEKVPMKSVSKMNGFESIDQISRERIRRAAEKIKKEHPDRVGIQDFGFKAFKVASSNYKNVAATPSETTQSNLFDSVSNIKPDRTPLDLLYQVILSWGIDLSINVESVQIESNMVYNVGDGLLLACFDESISESTVRKMAAQQPSMATFRDDAFGRSADKINLGEIFKELSPETKVKVI